MFVGLGTSGVVPILHILATEYSYSQLNDIMGLNWVLLQGFLYVFGAFLYAVRALIQHSWVSILINTKPRPGGRSASFQDLSTYWGALTRYFMSVCCWQPVRTCAAWPKPLTSTIAFWARNVKIARQRTLLQE